MDGEKSKGSTQAATYAQKHAKLIASDRVSMGMNSTQKVPHAASKLCRETTRLSCDEGEGRGSRAMMRLVLDKSEAQQGSKSGRGQISRNVSG